MRARRRTPRYSRDGARRHLVVTLVAATLAACAEYQTFSTTEYVRDQLAARIGAAEAAALALPFELNPQILGSVGARLDPRGSERRRASAITDFVFESLDLQYRLFPTRDANGTFTTRQGNCLSFTNLFVGLARAQRLNAFYVEVEDAQRWSYEAGAVVSQGHIVAGVYLDGQLATFDFLPYRRKAYRDFHPIDDVEATAHYYNNLGAEALLTGDAERAATQVSLAAAVAPEFTPALNNLGVIRSRQGDRDGAIAAYRAGLAVDPENVPILTNLVRLYQQSGETERAGEVLAKLDSIMVDNPYLYIYRAETALAAGDGRRALEHLADALRRAPELPDVHVALVKAFLAVGNVDRARHHLARALRLDATHPEAVRLARLLDAESGARTGEE